MVVYTIMAIYKLSTYNPTNPWLKSENFRMTAEYPLAILSWRGSVPAPQLLSLQRDTQETMVRLLWNQHLPYKIRILYRMCSPVLETRFKIQLMKVLDTWDPNHWSWHSFERTKHGHLETNWNRAFISITKHHLIPSSRGGNNDERNYYWLPDYIHADFHKIFGILTPIEQMAYLLLLFAPVEQTDFTMSLARLLTSANQNHFYERDVLKGRGIRY